MNRVPRRALPALLLPSFGTAAGARAQAVRDLTIVSWGGAYQEAQREVFFRPFQQRAGVRLLEETWDGGLGALRTRLAAGVASWDVVVVEGDELALGCEEGLFERLDPAAFGGTDRFVPGAVQPCGLGAATYAFTLSFDRAAMPGAPVGWGDFFDLSRFPGRRAMRRSAKSTLEIALMGDGVPPAAVYGELATGAGTDRAFRRLESIRDWLAWWERGSAPQRQLAAGEVVMAVAYSGRVAVANRDAGRDFGTVWRGAIRAMDYWALARQSPNRDRALEFLRFAADPAVQAALPPRIPYAVTARAALEALPADLRATLPDAPERAAEGLGMDDAFWARHGDRLSRRFEAWLAR
ncbi:extracellular solute-binding protein [Roseomonas sp. CCTCC AB2023176]|uniref:extracellular solute-binding protein n=1 Tax=Roseomonas sp. CCTCC AB2023176 TaxID=3342640 RepID=UPI0035D77FA2